MTLDTLRDDLETNRKRFDDLYTVVKAKVPVVDGVTHQTDQALLAVLEFVKLALTDRDAYQEAVLDEVDEIDGALEDIFNRNEEMILPATAEQILMIVVSAEGLINELRPRLKRDSAHDKKLALGCVDLAKRCVAMKEILNRITVTPTEEGDDEDEDGADEAVPAPTGPVLVPPTGGTDANAGV